MTTKLVRVKNTSNGRVSWVPEKFFTSSAFNACLELFPEDAKPPVPALYKPKAKSEAKKGHEADPIIEVVEELPEQDEE